MNLLFGIICSLYAVADAAEAHNVVDRIEKKLEGISDIQGEFVQTSYLKDLDRTERYSGEFYVKKPSRLKWRYSDPRDEDVLISGDNIWIYKASEHQVVKSTFNGNELSQVPLALLESLEDIDSDYTAEIDGNDVLILVPKQRMGFIKSLSLDITTGEFPISAFTIFDTYGNRNVIELKNVKVNPGLADSLFEFTVPLGAELFDYSR